MSGLSLSFYAYAVLNVTWELYVIPASSQGFPGSDLGLETGYHR